jgi:hypothetical protein
MDELSDVIFWAKDTQDMNLKPGFNQGDGFSLDSCVRRKGLIKNHPDSCDAVGSKGSGV